MPDDVDLRPAASCGSCRSTELRPLIVLERRGDPPWIRPHRGMVYRHVVVFLCATCLSAQLARVTRVTHSLPPRDLVAAWSVDRLGRSLQQLLSFLSELHAKGVDLYLHQQGVDTSTPAGKALFQMLGVFAEFERAMIVERIRAGLRRAVAEGKRLGRPRVSSEVESAIRRELAKGRGIHAVAQAVGVGAGTVQRVRAEVAS